MRIVTVRQPWAWAIVHGGKDVENRPRNIAGDYRGLVAIHAGQRADTEAHERASWPTLHAAMQRTIRDDDALEPGDLQWQRDAGHIIGVVNLWAVHRDRDAGNCCPHRPVGGRGGSPWAERDVWHLCLTNAQPLTEPIPYTGALGLRRLDAATIARVIRRLP